MRFTKRIVEVTKDESDAILEYLFRHISQNHDLQVRFKWNKNDIAIWDNRSTYHTATYVFFVARLMIEMITMGQGREIASSVVENILTLIPYRSQGNMI